MSYDIWANECASRNVASKCVLSMAEERRGVFEHDGGTLRGVYKKWVKRVYAHDRWYEHMDFREIVVDDDGVISAVVYGG